MYVTRVRVEDIKGFTGSRTADLTLPARGGWTVIAGRNSSGKSTLLQAIALALGGPSAARSLVADFSDWPTTGADLGRVEARVVRDDPWDQPVGSGRPATRELVLGLQWSRTAEGGAGRTRRPVLDPFGRSGALGADRVAERGPWAENPRGWFCAGYGPFRRLVGGSGEAQRLMLAAGPTGRMATLFHEDASLAEGVPWLRDLHLRDLERRPGVGPLLEAVLRLLGDGLLPERYQITKVDSDGLWVAKSGNEQPYPLQEMSDGYRTVAALVLDIVRQIHAAYDDLATEPTDSGGIAVTAPGVVLIDEVDAHLHVTWQRRIGGWLREHFPNIQFIVSSHSPYICQDADPGGLIRLPGPDEHGPPTVVDEELYQRIVYGSGDDAALSELFGLETPYSDRAERKRQRLVELERKVYAGTASATEAAEYRDLSALLNSSLETRVTEVAARLDGEP